MPPAREHFSLAINSEILSALRSLAQSEGQPLQSLVDEALADLIKKRKQGKPRAHVMGAYQGSHETFTPLYKKLAD